MLFSKSVSQVFYYDFLTMFHPKATDEKLLLLAINVLLLIMELIAQVCDLIHNANTILRIEAVVCNLRFHLQVFCTQLRIREPSILTLK